MKSAATPLRDARSPRWQQQLARHRVPGRFIEVEVDDATMGMQRVGGTGVTSLHSLSVLYVDRSLLRLPLLPAAATVTDSRVRVVTAPTRAP
mmetsp:Transcript_15339/g.53293  ORF Transcript_15339/g.53293 Transcript_15339/m.53293 type:complete len:92 (+) Transcript_15339:504-779(+)